MVFFVPLMYSEVGKNGKKKMEMTLSNHLKGGGAEESLTKTKRRKRGGGRDS